MTGSTQPWGLEEHTGAFQQLDDSSRSCWRHRLEIVAEPANIDDVKAIHILLGRDCVADVALAHVWCDRKLDEDFVDGTVGVEIGDVLQNLGFRGRVRKPQRIAGDS